MYKVFPCSDTTSNDIILKGMLAADADNCDIISLSLGSDSGYHSTPLSMVASRITQDRLVVVAAGNSGEQGIFYASSPASGRGVLSVASVNARQVLRWPATVRSSSGQELAISYITSDGTKVNETVNAPITFDAGDACNPESYGEESQALVIQRGVCMWAGAYNTLMYNGFGYYLIFDSYNQGVFYPSDALNSNPSIHLFGLTAASVGAWVKEEIAAGHNLTLVIKPDEDPAASDPDNTFDDFPGTGQVSYFSSWGPTFENDFSPKIAGPGGFVYGAHPDNKYVVQSGTSFSTPYLAGVAALFYAHVKKDSKEFLRRISATATTLPAWDEREKSVLADIAPLAQQGSGLVDAVKVVDYQTILLSDSHISLNDTDNRVSTHKVRLANTGSSQVTYKISHVAAASVKSRDEYLYPYTYMPPLTAASGSINAPSSITIAPGSTQEVEVTFNKPANDQENSGTVGAARSCSRARMANLSPSPTWALRFPPIIGHLWKAPLSSSATTP
uniref:Peptidase S8/S53 domain-containing protein n=1 Tax=Bionectria ochroleuca TaxID=29856 RepID=A0A8H7NQH7_BIOOC